MINWFKIKKYITFLIMSAVPLAAFFASLISLNDLLMSAIVWLMVTAVMMFIASRFLAHPLLNLLEGSGILGMTFDSTGVIQPFTIHVNPPYIRGRLGRKEIEDIWNRDATFYLKNPRPGKMAVAEGADGEEYEVIVLGKKGEDHNEKLFNFEGHLTFIYNKTLDEFLTKDALAKFEKSTLVKHAVLYLNKKAEELDAKIRDFARYIVEQAKPKKFWGMGNWFWVIIVVAVLLILLLFLPAFMDVFSSGIGGISQVVPVQPVTPAP